MRAEQEKWSEKIWTAALRLSAGRLEQLVPEGSCQLFLLAGGSCVLGSGADAMVLNTGSVLLLGGGTELNLQQSGHVVPELIGCSFSTTVLQGLRTAAQRDFTRMFPAGECVVLAGPPQWNSRLRTLLELMRSAEGEPGYPGPFYLTLLLHYVEQQYVHQSEAAHPHNETVERICAYLAANYQKKFSLSEVAAQFYLSPYYLSRLFRRVTGQSIVDYINGRRIEAAQRLLEGTELSISAVAEQTGFSSSAHFRRVFREMMGVGPQQYRKSHRRE